MNKFKTTKGYLIFWPFKHTFNYFLKFYYPVFKTVTKSNSSLMTTLLIIK